MFTSSAAQFVYGAMPSASAPESPEQRRLQRPLSPGQRSDHVRSPFPERLSSRGEVAASSPSSFSDNTFSLTTQSSADFVAAHPNYSRSSGRNIVPLLMGSPRRGPPGYPAIPSATVTGYNPSATMNLKSPASMSTNEQHHVKNILARNVPLSAAGRGFALDEHGIMQSRIVAPLSAYGEARAVGSFRSGNSFYNSSPGRRSFGASRSGGELTPTMTAAVAKVRARYEGTQHIERAERRYSMSPRHKREAEPIQMFAEDLSLIEQIQDMRREHRREQESNEEEEKDMKKRRRATFYTPPRFLGGASSSSTVTAASARSSARGSQTPPPFSSHQYHRRSSSSYSVVSLTDTKKPLHSRSAVREAIAISPQRQRAIRRAQHGVGEEHAGAPGKRKNNKNNNTNKRNSSDVVVSDAAVTPFQAAMRAKTPREKSIALGLLPPPPASSRPAADSPLRRSARRSSPEPARVVVLRPGWNPSGNPRSLSSRTPDAVTRIVTTSSSQTPSAEARKKIDNKDTIANSARFSTPSRSRPVSPTAAAAAISSSRPKTPPSRVVNNNNDKQKAARVPFTITSPSSLVKTETGSNNNNGGDASYVAWQHLLWAAKRDGFNARDICRLSWGGVRGLCETYGIGRNPIEAAHIQLEWSKRREIMQGAENRAVLLLQGADLQQPERVETKKQEQHQHQHPSLKNSSDSSSTSRGVGNAREGKRVTFEQEPHKQLSGSKTGDDRTLDYFFADSLTDGEESGVVALMPRMAHAPRVKKS